MVEKVKKKIFLRPKWAEREAIMNTKNTNTTTVKVYNNYQFDLSEICTVIIGAGYTLPERKKALSKGVAPSDYDAFVKALDKLCESVYAYALEGDKRGVDVTRYTGGKNAVIDKYLDDAMKAFRAVADMLGTKTHVTNDKAKRIVPCDAHTVGMLVSEIRKGTSVSKVDDGKVCRANYWSVRTHSKKILFGVMGLLSDICPVVAPDEKPNNDTGNSAEKKLTASQKLKAMEEDFAAFRKTAEENGQKATAKINDLESRIKAALAFIGANSDENGMTDGRELIKILGE